MKLISRKLRSKTGASMLIAILFMMFCLFVGGSVLAAATANGYRVAHMSDQQDFLNQRSAGLLIADELNHGLDQGENLSLSVEYVQRTYRAGTVLDGGGWVDGNLVSDQRTLKFVAPFTPQKSMTAMQRLLYETAVCRYLHDNEINLADVQVELEGFYYEGTQISWGGFWFAYSPTAVVIEGTLNLEGTIGTQNFTEYQVKFSSGAREIMYDFMVGFSNSQMTVTADANVYTGDTHNETMITNDPAYGGYVKLTVSAVETEIRWNHAYIEKGGKGA